MALKIKPTPILYGKDSEEFERRRKVDEISSVSKSDYERAEEVYKGMLKKEYI